MAFIPSPGVAQAVVVAKWANLIDIRQVFHVQRRGELIAAAWDTTALTNAGYRVSGAYNIFLDNVSNVLQVSSIDLRDLLTASGAVFSLPTAIAGTLAAQTTGPYEGPVIRWKTGLAGRTNGRTFLPGIDETVVDNVGLLSAARLAATDIRVANFLAYLGAPTDATHLGAPLDLVIQSTKATAGPNSTRPAYKVIAGTTRPEVGIQRRRRLS